MRKLGVLTKELLSILFIVKAVAPGMPDVALANSMAEARRIGREKDLPFRLDIAMLRYVDDESSFGSRLHEM